MPLPEKVEDTALQLRKYVSDYQKESANRQFKTREDAIMGRAMAGKIEESLAEILAQRQLVQRDDGWCWGVDERLRHASAIKMTDSSNEALLMSIKSPVQVFLATGGMGAYQKMKECRLKFESFQWMDVEGHHHLQS